MKIEYQSSVLTPAGYRSVDVIATAKPITPKRCEVLEVLSIDGDTPKYGMSRTGANRQRYNGIYLAENEIGKKKIVSRLRVID